MRWPCGFVLAVLLGAALPAHAADEIRSVLDLSPQNFTPVKSKWEAYFGTHYRTLRMGGDAVGRTIRDYDGPNVMLPPDFSVSDGYSRENVLHNFRNWRRPDAQGLDANAAEIIASGLDVIYGATFLKRDGTLDEVRTRALVDSIYGYRKELLDHVYIQWGNEINGKHIGSPPPSVTERLGMLDAQFGGMDWMQNNRPRDQRRFVENYFLPLVSVVREVSAKLFNDPAAIRIMSPSFANIYNPRFRQWMYGILDFPVDAKKFPGLGATQVAETVDILTVHYPFARPDGAAAMQEIWNRYGATGKIGALWVTEDYGSDTSGPAGLIDRALRYFSWLAANRLDANQTRLCWWGIEAEYSGGKPIDAAVAMARWMSGRQLGYRQFKVDGETMDAIYAGDASHPRYLLAFRAHPAQYHIALSGAALAPNTGVKATLYSVKKKPVVLTPSLAKAGDRLNVDLDVGGDGPLLVFIGD